jgi:TetR/AcrR family transcriptional regulator
MQAAPRGRCMPSDPKPRPEMTSASTSERILDAAELHFAGRGFAGAGMRDIASAVDLNPASLYNHFPSKQALYEAVLERGLRPIFEVLDALHSTDWSPESLNHETNTLLAGLARRPHMARLIVHEALAGGENLRRIARDWLRPLYSRALATFQESPTTRDWEQDELPLLLMSFHHLVLGYFAAAPMLREVMHEDPLSPEAMERQSRFMRKIVRLLVLDARSGASRNDRTRADE